MRLPTRTYSTSELYPPDMRPEHREVLIALYRDLVIGKVVGGKPLIRRFATDAERGAAGLRSADLRAFVVKPTLREVEAVFLDMKVGFGDADSDDEAQVKADAYAKALVDLPSWATKRACLRFARGEVTAEELGEQKLRRGYVPSTAHVHMVAAAMVKPVWREAANLYAVLNGVLPPREKGETPEERARGLAATSAWLEQSGAVKREAVTHRADAEARLAADRRHAQAHRDHIRREYAEAGLDVPEDDGNLVSLALRVRLGWRVETDPSGDKVLTAPPAPPVHTPAKDRRSDAAIAGYAKMHQRES